MYVYIKYVYVYTYLQCLHKMSTFILKNILAIFNLNLTCSFLLLCM